VSVPYATATNGFGTATAAVGGYSDFWTATTTPDPAAIDPYWTADPDTRTDPTNFTNPPSN